MSWVWILIILFVIMIAVIVAVWWTTGNTTYVLLVGGFFFLVILLMVGIIAMEPVPKRVVIPPQMPVQAAPTLVVHEHMAPVPVPQPVPQPVPAPQPVYYQEPLYQEPMMSTSPSYQEIHLHIENARGQSYDEDDIRTVYSGSTPPVSYGQRDIIPNGTRLVSERKFGQESVDRRPIQQTRVTPATQYESVVTDERGNRYPATVKQPGKVTSVITNPPEQQTRILPPGQRPFPGARYYKDERTGLFHLVQ